MTREKLYVPPLKFKCGNKECPGLGEHMCRPCDLCGKPTGIIDFVSLAVFCKTCLKDAD